VTLLTLRVQPLAARGARARARVDRDEVGRERLEARPEREDEARDAEARRLGQVARPARADAAAVDDGHARLLGQRGLVRVPDEEYERLLGRAVLEDLQRGGDQ